MLALPHHALRQERYALPDRPSRGFPLTESHRPAYTAGTGHRLHRPAAAACLSGANQRHRGRDKMLEQVEPHRACQGEEQQNPPCRGTAPLRRRHHETVLDQRDTPAEEDDQRQRELAEPSRALQFQMTVPCERHENIRTGQQ